MKISHIVTLLCSAATVASAAAIQKRQTTPAAPVEQYKAPTYVRPKHPSKRVQTAFDVLDGFKEWTVEGVTRWNGPGFQHQVLPLSRGAAVKDAAAWKTYFKSIEPLFRGFTPVINDLYEDEKKNAVVIWARSTANTPIGPYANEYMLTLYMTKDQKKVETFLEFVDIGVSRDFFPKLNAWVAANPSLKW